MHCLPIVAADGADAEAGLPGIQPGSPSFNQPVVEVFSGVHLTVDVAPQVPHLEKSP